MSQALRLDQKIRTQVQRERKITHEILLTIQEIDLTQCYRELGYSSLWDYLVRGLGYSEGAAHRRISSARLLRQCPEVAPKLQEGKINLSQLSQLQSAIRQEEKKSRAHISRQQKQEAVKNLEGKNHLETQKILVKTFKEFEPPKPKLIPKKNNKIQVTLEFNEEDWEDIKSLLAKISHKVPDQKIESALIYWARQIKKKHEKKDEGLSESAAKYSADTQQNGTKRNVQQQDTSKQIQVLPIVITAQIRGAQVHNGQPPKRRRKYISIKVKNQVFEKADHQCEYVSVLTQKRCEARHYLDLEHAKPLALGGTDEIKNLRVMCRSHNQLMAKQMHLFRE